jgi:hypothetical protein
MRREIILVLIGFIVVHLSCSEVDNYDTPDGWIYGKLTDQITHESFQSEQPNGFTIRLFEKGGRLNAPINISGKPDGTFENSFIFQNEYKLIPVDGAFFEVTDTIVVQVGAKTEVNLTIIPFLAVTDVTIIPEPGSVTAIYNIARSQIGGKITTRQTLVSSVNTVSNAVHDFQVSTSVTSISDEILLSTQFTDVVTGLTSGNEYWVRVAVLAANSLNRYNYSKVFKVKIP